MDPLTIGAVGVTGFALLKASGESEAEEKKPPVTDAKTPAPGGKDPNTFVDDVANAVPLIAGAAGVSSLAVTAALAKVFGEAYLTAKIGAAMTGDKGTGLIEGAISGDLSNVNPAIVATEYVTTATQLMAGGGVGAGIAVNVGRVVGREFDQLAGGDGQSGTGLIAQVGGGAVGLAGALGGVLAGFAVGVYAIVAYAIGSIVSDINRLEYGQKGARKDFDDEWFRVQTKLFYLLRGATIDTTGETIVFKAGGMSAASANRISWPYADGYMRKQNRLAFQTWMRRGRGFLSLGTTTDTYHGKFGTDRGYFAGVASAGGIHIGLLNEPVDKSLTPDYYFHAQVPKEQLATVRRFEVVGYETVEEENEEAFKPNTSVFNLGPTESYCSIRKAAGATIANDLMFKVKCYHKVTRPIYAEQTFLQDPMRTAMLRMGEIDANVAAYVKWMAEDPHGAFVGDEGHMEAGLKDGRFDGRHTGYGTLTCEGWEVVNGIMTFKERTVNFRDFIQASKEGA